MSKETKALLVGVICAYGLTAFVAWNWNPAEWETAFRWAASAIFVGVAGLRLMISDA